MIPVFYSAGYEDWTAEEDSTWWGFKDYYFQFCISGAVKGFLKISLNRKDFNMKESRELLLKSLIPFLLQTSLSLSYLLHNSMSQKLFGEASKRTNKKQEEKRKLRRKNWKGNLWWYQLSIYSASEWRQTLEMGLGDGPPPPFISAWQKIH